VFVGDVGPPQIKCDYADRIGTWEKRNDMTGAAMRTLLRILLAGLGVSAVLIALSILTLGAGATAAAGERVLDALSGWRGPASPPWSPTMDNELRFYAALWGAYGDMLLLAARDYIGWAVRVPWLAAVFFVGGRWPRALLAGSWRAAPLLPAAQDDRTGSAAGARPAVVARGRVKGFQGLDVDVAFALLIDESWPVVPPEAQRTLGRGGAG
jgi:hypothetical protein